MNPTEAEIKNLEKLWNELLPNLPGVIKSSSKKPKKVMAVPGHTYCEKIILDTWSPMPALNLK